MNWFDEIASWSTEQDDPQISKKICRFSFDAEAPQGVRLSEDGSAWEKCRGKWESIKPCSAFDGQKSISSFIT
ncbi:MAG: hypothetical protein WBQ23_06935 [Bacteroidota bacterium]